MHSFRKALSLACAVVLSSSLVACGSNSDDPGSQSSQTSSASSAADSGQSSDAAPASVSDIQVMFPFPDSIVWSGYEIARGKYYEGLGLKPETVPVNGNSGTMLQVASGNVDFAVSGVAELIRSAADGKDVVGIASLNTDLFAIRALDSSPVKSVADLKGKKLGVPSMSDGALPIVYAALKAANLTVGTDVELVVVGDAGPAVAKALRDGSIDALAGAEVDAAIMRASGLNLVSILQDEFKGLPSNELVMSGAAYRDPAKRKVAIDFAAGYLAGVAYGAKSPDDALTVVCKYAPDNCGDQNIAKELFKSIIAGASSSAADAGKHDPDKVSTVANAIVANDGEVAVDGLDLTKVFTNDATDEISSVMAGLGD